MLVLRVGAQTSILSMEKEILEIRKTRADIEAEIAILELRVAELRRGSRIKTIARDHLGMITPVGAPKNLF